MKNSITKQVDALNTLIAKASAPFVCQYRINLRSLNNTLTQDGPYFLRVSGNPADNILLKELMDTPVSRRKTAQQIDGKIIKLVLGEAMKATQEVKDIVNNLFPNVNTNAYDWKRVSVVEDSAEFRRLPESLLDAEGTRYYYVGNNVSMFEYDAIDRYTVA